MYTEGERLTPVYIEDEMKTAYLDYAMSVIVSRALPDVRDGLKPVQRRILFAMHEMGLTHSKPYRKSARVVGETFGKYHPHEGGLYEAMVRMVQDFSLRYPLVDGQGNFGSIDGDPPAAARYTEARMARMGEELLNDIGKRTVDFTANFDASLQEPKVLPASVPALLVNGASGIAVGMATNVPPHNLREIVDAVVLVIDKPDVGLRELQKIVKGPDFPTGALIYGRKGIDEAYRTGRGIVRMRARAAIETVKRGGERQRIIVTEIPYQVNKSKLLESMAQLVTTKKITGISDLRDESDKDGMRVVIELKRDTESQVVLNQLYKHTQMQDSFGVNMLALVEGRPQLLTLKALLQHFIAHRREVITRRTHYDLTRAETRAHILEGLKIALGKLDAVIKTIRSSPDTDTARKNLMTRFKLSERQAQAILEMRLQRLTGLERKKIDDEYLVLIKEIARLKAILASEAKLMRLVRDEIVAVKERYGDERRSEIVAETGDFSVEDLIAEEDMVTTISHAGYIKRLPVTTYRRQHRGGKGVTGAGTKEEDFIEHLFIASSHDYILFFTDKGRVYWLKVYELPQAGRLSKGKAIPNLLRLGQGESVTAFLQMRDFTGDKYVMMATAKGVLKKTALEAFSHPRAGGIIAIGLDKGDRLIEVDLVSGDQQLFLATMQGQAIRFPASQLRSIGRAGRGVRGIRLGKGDLVVGMEVVGEGATVLTVTANGYGKRSLFDSYRVQSRGGKGVINIRANKKNGAVVGLKTVRDDDELMLITEQGMVIRMSAGSVRVTGRNAQGVKVIALKPKDRLVGVARLAAKDEEEEEPAAAKSE